MGNSCRSQFQLSEKKNMIWIDSDVYSYSNQNLYDEYLSQKFNIRRCTSIQDGIEKLLEAKKFTSVIIIISGAFYLEFYKELNKIKNKLKISIIIIVFLRRINLFIQNLKLLKIFQKDDFLCPKYITNSLIDLKDSLENKFIEKELIFENIENYDELILPTYFSYLMTETTKTEISYFNEFIKRSYPQYKKIQNLINQLEENKYNSKNIICDYWLYIYSLETLFYSDINESLRKKKGDFYNPFVKMCYEMVKKGHLRPITNKKLYRGSKIKINEYQYMIDFLKNKNNKEFPKLIVYSRCFLSFSENEIVANDFLIRNQNHERNDAFDGYFIIEEITDKNLDMNCLSNASIKEYSNNSIEDEVLVFPLSCFEITQVIEKNNGKNYKEIHLNYLGKYSEEIKKKYGDKFLNNIINSEYARELNDFYLINYNFILSWITKEEKKIKLYDICFFLENSEDFVGFLDNKIKIFSINLNKEKQLIEIHQNKIINIIKLNDNKICSSSIDKKINIIKLINNNKEYEIIQIIQLNQSYAKQILFLSNFDIIFLKNNNIIDFFIFKNEKYIFNNCLRGEKNIISIKDLPNQEIVYATNDNYIIFVNTMNQTKLELKLKNKIIDNQNMIIYEKYLIIAGDCYIYLIDFMSKNKEILSFYLILELTKIINITSDKIMLSLYDKEKNVCFIREFKIKFIKLNFECIGEGFCENKKIENIVMINPSKIITKIKNNPFLIWEKLNIINESYKQKYINKIYNENENNENENNENENNENENNENDNNENDNNENNENENNENNENENNENNENENENISKFTNIDYKDINIDYEELEDDYPIGIDIGTKFCRIGVYRNGGVEIIPNRNGETNTPSIVILTKDSEILVGEETTDFLVKDYDCCIYEIIRLIGNNFCDKTFQEVKKKLPFKIVRSNQGDYPEVEIQVNGKTKRYSPVQILSFLIKKLVTNAENYLNKKINSIFITIPADFNNSQKKLTKLAAELSGLNVLGVINEPTAAALAYGFDKKENTKEKILIFDLGGGTFDVSILDLYEKDYIYEKYFKSFKVLSTSGDKYLGGEDFDNILVDFVLGGVVENNGLRKEIKEQVMKDKKAIKILKDSCENIKKILSNAESALLYINNFYRNEDINKIITRKEFEEVCQPLFEKLKVCLDEALMYAHLKKGDINQIILVGGSTRIPKVKELIQNYFPKCKINNEINPEEVLAYGATIYAEKILYNKNINISNFNLIDIVPLSLGINILNNSNDPLIRNEGDIMSIIIKRGNPIPVFNEKIFYSTKDNQTNMSINIYEGEKKYVKYNNLIKKYIIKGLTKRPKGKTKVIVRFEIDINGILNVKAKEESANNNGKELELIIKNDGVTLFEEDIEEIKKKNYKTLIEKIEIKDYSNIKEILRKYKEEYEEYKNNKGNYDEDDEEDEDYEENKISYITYYNEALEKFIDKFNKDLYNETVLKKYYLYVKELFSSYVETLTLLKNKSEKHNILENIRKFIEIFIYNNSGYLNTLLEILKKIKKVDFNNIVRFVMEKLNEKGKEYIYSNTKFCKYHSLMFFEKSKSFYEQYLSGVNQAYFTSVLLRSLNREKNLCLEYLEDIKSGVIVLCMDSIINEKLYIENLSGITNDLHKFSLKNLKNNIEFSKRVLLNYERALSSIQAQEQYINCENKKKEAICIINIIKINEILGYLKIKSKNLFILVERCQFLIDNLKWHLDEKEEWYKEFLRLSKILRNYKN